MKSLNGKNVYCEYLGLIGNSVGERGVTMIVSMIGEALKYNRSLIEINLGRDSKNIV